jgi:hypothetical protein
LKLFENGAFSVSSVMALLFYLLVGALPFIVPIFLQDAVNFSGSMTGIVMTAFMIGSIASGMSSGVLIQKMQARTSCKSPWCFVWPACCGYWSLPRQP